MAKAVAPIEIEDAGVWRWHVRTGSIRGTTEALSSLWGRVAREADAGGADDHPAAAIVRGDSQMADHARNGDDGIRVRTRTSVLTLVVVAPRPELVDRAMTAVSTLGRRHESCGAAAEREARARPRRTRGPIRARSPRRHRR